MIDPITLHILEEQGMIEGYCLKCALCGRQVEIVKDGEGPLSCCNKRMFVMSGSPEPASEGQVRFLTEEEDQELFEIMITEQLIYHEAVDKFNRMDKLEVIGEENLSELQLHELKKTRDWATRVSHWVQDPSYRERKKDLMKLRKSSTGAQRKKFKEKFKKLAKQKPGAAIKLAKLKDIGLDKVSSAMARRAAAKRLGGYHKYGTVHDAEERKRKAAEKSQKKAAKQSIKRQQGLMKSKIKHEKQKRKKQMKAQIKKIKQGYAPSKKKKAPASPARKYKSREAKGYGGTSGKKDFDPGSFMSLDSLQLDTELSALIAEKEGLFDKAKRLGKEGILIKKYVDKEKNQKKK